MMQPRNAKLYIPGIDEVSKDFIAKYELEAKIKHFFTFGPLLGCGK